MANSKYILAIDQGTTSSRSIIYDENLRAVGLGQQEFSQIYPHPGWVEHDAEVILSSQLEAIIMAMKNGQITPESIAAIGITNQRETTVVWNKTTGKPIYNAIVWQDRRTSKYCDSLKNKWSKKITQKTGLIIDAYFSATKIKWVLDNVPEAQKLALEGQLAFGTIDTWLTWNLSGGSAHITDVSNASRTMLFNISTLAWDDELLELFQIPKSMLPKVVDSSGVLAQTNTAIFETQIPISGLIGDQQSALFGQLCLQSGMAKSTYGTGCFLMLNTGNKIVKSTHNLLATIGWRINNEVTYALEGSVFVGGAVIQWLRDEMEFFVEAADSETLAEAADDNGGIYFVPALTGLGAPHWDPNARGSIFGITRGTTKAHLTRAALESICFQVNDVLQAMAKDLDDPIHQLRVDGGAAANDLLLQFQSDISQINVLKPSQLETTALGAAMLAGLGVGFWSMTDLENKWKLTQEFSPQLSKNQVAQTLLKWNEAVGRSKNWES